MIWKAFFDSVAAVAFTAMVSHTPAHASSTAEQGSNTQSGGGILSQQDDPNKRWIYGPQVPQHPGQPGGTGSSGAGAPQQGESRDMSAAEGQSSGTGSPGNEGQAGGGTILQQNDPAKRWIYGPNVPQHPGKPGSANSGGGEKGGQQQ